MPNRVLLTVLIVGLVISLAANAVLVVYLAEARIDAQEARQTATDYRIGLQTAIDREAFDWNSFLPILALAKRLADAAESADNKEIALRAAEFKAGLKRFWGERAMFD